MNEIKLIETNGQTIAIVEVPEDATLIQITQNASWRNLSYKINNKPHPFEYTHIKLPDGQYQILGKSTELNGDHIVECKIIDRKIEYRNYRNGKFNLGNPNESYLSLLEANGIVDRNLIEKPEFNYEFGEDGPTDSQLLSAEIHFDESFKQWQEAQSKVRHYLILIKK